jgi:hypothetical protein
MMSPLGSLRSSADFALNNRAAFRELFLRKAREEPRRPQRGPFEIRTFFVIEMNKFAREESVGNS